MERRGVTALSATSGRVGDTLTVTLAATADGGVADDWSVSLEYRGAATVSPFGEHRATGARYMFSYGRFEPRMDWDVRFYRWADTTAATISTTSSTTRSSIASLYSVDNHSAIARNTVSQCI